MSVFRCFLVSGFGCVDGVTPTETPAAGGSCCENDDDDDDGLNTKRVLHT